MPSNPLVSDHLGHLVLWSQQPRAWSVFEQSVLVRAGGYIPLGRGPDTGPVRNLTVPDVVDNSPAFTSAVASYGLRSEYGAAPAGLLAQVGIYY